jgi:Dolichyl-phosphate-mannose-protein mannosyltransferase
MTRRLGKVTTRAAAGLLAAYFLYGAIGSLRAEFTHDDLMNFYRAWAYPLSSLLADNICFVSFTPLYRPLGELVYRIFFELFGFNLFPLRVLLLLALGVNVFLVYKVCELITGFQETGFFAALLGAYHMKFAQLYYNSGTTFDILAFLFYFSAVVYYVRIRSRDREVGVRSALIVCGLYVLALDSKELAVSLPLTLLVYELLWHSPAIQSRELWRWASRRMLTVWVTGLMTAAYVWGRVLFPEHGISSVGDYRMTLSVGEYFGKLAYYLNDLFYARNWLDAKGAAIFAACLVAAGLASRSRALLFGALLFLGGILPMAFIPPRSLSAIYLPLVGLAIYGAVAVASLCSGLRRLCGQASWQVATFWWTFVALGLLLLESHPSCRLIYHALKAGEYAQIRDAREQLLKLHPEFPSGSRILIVGTPFPQYSPGYNNMFLIRLSYRDQSLTVQELARFEVNGRPPDLADFDYLLSYEDGRWIDIDPATVVFKLPDH